MPLPEGDLSFSASDASEGNSPSGSSSDLGDTEDFQEPPDDDEFEQLDFDDADIETNDFSDQGGSIYTDYQVTQTYLYDSGVLQLPVAVDDDSGSTPCDFIQVSAPYGQRVVVGTAEREGLTPELPDPFEDINPNEVLLRAVCSFANPFPMILGTSYAYQASWTYTYGSTNPWRPGASNGGLLGSGVIPIGKLTPILNPNSKDVNIFPTATRFVQGIVEPADQTDDNEIAEETTDAQVQSQLLAQQSGGAVAQFF